ncbi:MAG: PilZ domain-containing protein [Candidatus Omnitrophica bacterium]|nr:PilZ domain-containing protein [Candidatus Omnitrophota bacterium]
METRKAPRIGINLTIHSKIPSEHKQKFALISGMNFDAQIVDISILGIGMFSKYFLPKGLILELNMEGQYFGISEDITVKAEVRHCTFIKGRGYRSGMQFLNLSDKDKKVITEFINTHERRKEPRLKLTE